ncbi:MAG: cob(I)yrinic acid a,c-diamide adenosyltransferase [Caulobacteraceae bacterium]
MVTLNRIYTRAGDGGKTRLASGEKVSKASSRVEAYGGVDELNAAIGLARLHTREDASLDPILARVQNDLFDLGADLATPPPHAGRPAPLRIVAAQVERLEREIDALNHSLAPLTSFVLPGGSAASAALHLARTVCRRAERGAVGFAEQEGARADGAATHGEALRYLNRVSDLLFVAARFANDKGAADVLWTPGATR